MFNALKNTSDASTRLPDVIRKIPGGNHPLWKFMSYIISEEGKFAFMLHENLSRNHIISFAFE